MPAPAPDSQLVAQAKRGDLDAFEQLALRYERRVYSLARRILASEHDAEDVTQTSFISALEHLDSFREEASFSTWIHRIATFAALKVLRKRRGLDTISLEQATEPTDDGEGTPHPEFIADWAHTPTELASRNETRRAIEDALNDLEEKYRLIFLLRDVEGLSVRETAEALGLTETNVKVRLLRARLQLRERLTRMFGDAATALPAHQHDPAPGRGTGLPPTTTSQAI